MEKPCLNSNKHDFSAINGSKTGFLHGTFFYSTVQKDLKNVSNRQPCGEGRMKRVICGALVIFILLGTVGFMPNKGIVKAGGSPAPYYAEYANLGDYGLDNRVSSLIVSGTVVLYDDYNLSHTANSISFTDTSVPKLGNSQRGSGSGNWNDVAKSLKVSGNVTIYQDANYSGRKATFTSNDLSYDNIGTEWNQNPNLVKSNDSWDTRINNWLPDVSNIYHGDQNNYVQWNLDGQVVSRAQDGSDLDWKAVEFDQGNERYENEIPNLGVWPRGITRGTWDNCVSSLMVENGSVILYDGIGYTGENITFTQDVSNLGIYGWNDRISSLKLTEGSRVTLYFNNGYSGVSQSFACPSYQPSPLKVSGENSITLEAVVDNWYTDTWTGPGWTGVKFDVYASENPNDPDPKILMLELYIVRDGANLAWGNGFVRAPVDIGGKGYNVLLAMDCWPQYAQITLYPGNVAKWKIDIQGIIQRACNDFNNWWLRPDLHLDIDKLSIVKIGFTVESALGSSNPPYAGCSLNYLQLAYTTSNEMWLDPSFVDITGKSSGYRFNVTLLASTVVPSFTWQGTLTFDPAYLKATRAGYTSGSTSQFFVGHTTVPVAIIPDNTNGFVAAGETLLGTDKVSALSRSLCWFEFELITPVWNTNLVISGTQTQTFFLDSNLNEIPCMKYGSYVGVSGWKLTVSSAHGSPNPGIGECYFDNGTSVNCSVVSPVTEGGAVWICSGWSGSGSVPYSGNDSSVMFDITQDSNMTWNWMQAAAPQSNFTYSPVPPIQNQTTTFDASSSTSGGTIVSYEWDFGEGVNVTIANPITTYVFAYDGNHKVALTVIDSHGLNDTMLEVIDVLQHDVAVIDVVPYRAWVYEGQTLNVNVTVVNNGDFNETVTVDLYYNLTANQQIGTMITDLSLNETKTLTFVWDTLGVQHCHNYTITALANIQFDSNATNNVKEGAIRIKVRIMGDINGDGQVDMRDIGSAATAFGERPGDPRWLPWGPYADIDNNGIVNLKDIGWICRDFGKTCL